MAIKDKQSIFDVVLQEFGTLENTFDFLDDNSLEFNSKLSSNQPITVIAVNKGIENIKNFYSSNNFVLNNNQDLSDIGAYNDDYNDDYE